MPEPLAPVSGGAGEPRFVIGPLTLYADVARMAAWLEESAPGDEIVYATGPALGRDAAAGKLARQWADEGEVILLQRRVTHGKGRTLEYVARRREPPVQPRAGRRVMGAESVRALRLKRSRPQLRTAEDLDGTVEGRVLALLTRAAAAGIVCPSSHEIAVMLALNSRKAVDYAINKLTRADLIRVTHSCRIHGRQVTITASGASTAPVDGAARPARVREMG
jgi:hypothetical protein